MAPVTGSLILLILCYAGALADNNGDPRPPELIMSGDEGTKMSRGFVTFENPEDAKNAMEAMNEKTVDGRQIHVDQAVKSSSDRHEGYRGASSGEFGSPWDSRERGGGGRGYGGSNRFNRGRSNAYGGRGRFRDY